MKILVVGLNVFWVHALLAIPSLAQSNLNALTYEGTEYCIGVDTGTYYFAGTNVTGFGGADGETTRAEFSETIPDPVNQSQPGNVNQGLQTNQTTGRFLVKMIHLGALSSTKEVMAPIRKVVAILLQSSFRIKLRSRTLG